MGLSSETVSVPIQSVMALPTINNTSSIVNEVMRAISSLFIIFFKEKIFGAQKHKLNQNQLTKENKANKKQQRQKFFAHKNF